MQADEVPPTSFTLSQALVTIVTVVYGVAITAALTEQSGVVFNPQRAPYFIPGFALLATLLLASYFFFSYVLARAGRFPYRNLEWSPTNSGWRGAVSFGADLLLAALFVRTIALASAIPTSNPSSCPAHKISMCSPPDLTGLLASFVLIFALSALTRLIRSDNKLTTLVPAAGGLAFLALALVDHYVGKSRRNDLYHVYWLLILVVAYIILSQVIFYRLAMEPPKDPSLKARRKQSFRRLAEAPEDRQKVILDSLDSELAPPEGEDASGVTTPVIAPTGDPHAGLGRITD